MDAIKAIFKIILFIIINIVAAAAMYCAMFFYMEYLPGGISPHSVLLVSVESDDPRFLSGAVRTVGGQDDVGHGSFWNLTFVRFVYHDYDEVTAFEITDTSGNTVLHTFSKDGIASRDRVTVNPSTGEVARSISFRSYITGIIGPIIWVWLFVALVLNYVLLFAVYASIAFVRMIISIFVRHPSGAKRRFSGSIPQFIFCILIAAVLAFLYGAAVYLGEEDLLKEAVAEIDPFFYPLIVMYIAGTVLYPFAHRSFDGKQMRRDRRAQIVKDIDQAGHVKSYVRTKWSDGTETTDIGERRLYQYIWMVIFWILKLPFAPIVVYFAMIQNYHTAAHPEGWKTAPAHAGASSAGAPGAPGTQEAGSLSRQQEFAEGDGVFAYWADDGRYYPGIISAVNGNIYDISFFDGDTATLEPNGIVNVDYAFNYMDLWVDWERRGTYYQCRVIGMEGTLIKVQYIENGAYENVEFSRFIAMLR